MAIVYTSRIGYAGLTGLDITVKSAIGLGRVLAPSWALVGGHKRWKGYEPLDNQEYIALYLDLLRTRYRLNERVFADILQREQVVLLCYCRAGVFCHRHLAVDVLEKIAAAKKLPFSRGGELPEPGEAKSLTRRAVVS